MPLPFLSLLSRSLVPSSGRRFVSFSISNRIAEREGKKGERRGDLLLYNTQLPQQQLLPFAHKRERSS